VLTAFLIGLGLLCFVEVIDHHSGGIISRRLF
jgi:hypothetical protein